MNSRQHAITRPSSSRKMGMTARPDTAAHGSLDHRPSRPRRPAHRGRRGRQPGAGTRAPRALTPAGCRIVAPATACGACGRRPARAARPSAPGERGAPLGAHGECVARRAPGAGRRCPAAVADAVDEEPEASFGILDGGVVHCVECTSGGLPSRRKYTYEVVRWAGSARQDLTAARAYASSCTVALRSPSAGGRPVLKSTTSRRSSTRYAASMRPRRPTPSMSTVTASSTRSAPVRA